jgi:class 3 adenylate cyclase
MRWVVPLMAVSMLAYFGLNCWLFVDRGFNTALMAPLLAAALVTLCAVTERGWREERERRRVRSTLEQFVSPQVATEGVPTGTVTLVFADLEDSSTLSALHGEGFEAVRATYFRLLRDAARQWHGFEVETAGDSLFVVFSKAGHAVQFAVQAQIALNEHVWPPRIGRIAVRIGLHTGQPFVSKDRSKLTYRGPATNRAARVTMVAQGRQILLTDATYAAVQDEMPPDITFRFQGHHVLRGVGEDNLYEVCHPQLPTAFASPPVQDAAPPGAEHGAGATHETASREATSSDATRH